MTRALSFAERKNSIREPSDAESDPVLELMFRVLSLFSHGETVIENEAQVEKVFPKIADKLTEMAKT